MHETRAQRVFQSIIISQIFLSCRGLQWFERVENEDLR